MNLRFALESVIHCMAHGSPDWSLLKDPRARLWKFPLTAYSWKGCSMARVWNGVTVLPYSKVGRLKQKDDPSQVTWKSALIEAFHLLIDREKNHTNGESVTATKKRLTPKNRAHIITSRRIMMAYWKGKSIAGSLSTTLTLQIHKTPEQLVQKDTHIDH